MLSAQLYLRYERKGHPMNETSGGLLGQTVQPSGSMYLKRYASWAGYESDTDQSGMCSI